MTESYFESILDRNPADWDTRLLYADWLEEQGQHVRANGQRWQARERKFANSLYYRRNDDGLINYWADKFYAEKHDIGNRHIPHDVWALMSCGLMFYWTDKFYAEKHDIGNRHIPHDVWASMPCDPENKLFMHKNYNTRQLAEIALAEGLNRKGIAVEMQPSPVEAG
jgi:uncharacterized protein (TIGR02996 family)